LSAQARLFLERFEAEVAHIHAVWDAAIAETPKRAPRVLRSAGGGGGRRAVGSD
jgi:hypothetical protein